MALMTIRFQGMAEDRRFGPRRPAPSLAAASCARWMSFLLGALGLICPIDVPAQSPADPAREYDVKAVFLFNFTRFVEWPESAFATTNSPFVIGVLGPDPFGAILDRTVRDEQVRGRPLEVRRFAKPNDVSGCHLLFIAGKDSDRLEEMIRRTRGHPILTVGEDASFSRAGGMIAFRTIGGHVRFRINVEAAKTAGITISAKLLSLAQASDKEP